MKEDGVCGACMNVRDEKSELKDDSSMLRSSKSSHHMRLSNQNFASHPP
jgi:hypothetical protein